MSNFIEEILKQMDIQLDRIEICLNRLSEENIWKKVKSDTNSIGNLCVHLAGNEFQNFVSGIGQQPFIRERSKEFTDTKSFSREEIKH